jgi:hypothetical protein
MAEPVNINLLSKIAEATGGTYDMVTRANNVILEFGAEKDKYDEEIVSKKGLVVRDADHFITYDLDIDKAEVSGFNTIVPKSTARTLITTSQGYPIVTSWRYGLGRVLSYSTDDGSYWAGSILSKDNSKLITRMFAYAVGNPKRKEEYYVEIPDTEVGSISTVIVKSESLPQHLNMTFNMVEPKIYNAEFIPPQVGFNELLGMKFSVNTQKEFQSVGINPDFHQIITQTGGKVFDHDPDKIVDQARAKAKRLISEKVYFRWAFLLSALIVLLIELSVRRILSNRRKI